MPKQSKTDQQLAKASKDNTEVTSIQTYLQPYVNSCLPISSATIACSRVNKGCQILSIPERKREKRLDIQDKITLDSRFINTDEIVEFLARCSSTSVTENMQTTCFRTGSKQSSFPTKQGTIHTFSRCCNSNQFTYCNINSLCNKIWWLNQLKQANDISEPHTKKKGRVCHVEFYKDKSQLQHEPNPCCSCQN